MFLFQAVVMAENRLGLCDSNFLYVEIVGVFMKKSFMKKDAAPDSRSRAAELEHRKRRYATSAFLI